MREWEEIQEMLWSKRVVAGLFLVTLAAEADDKALWQEYGLVRQWTAQAGRSPVTVRQMKDLTGALAAWEWQRSPQARSCELTQFCSSESGRTVAAVENYVLMFDSPAPTREAFDELVAGLPNRRATSLPAILTFLPQEGRVPDSARYVLGPESLKQFAPELASTKPGFEQGAEAQVAEYRVGKNASPARLAIFYYATPEMARLHTADFKLALGPHVKRSGVLVAMALPAARAGPVPDQVADRLLGRVEYEAKITWNETPPPNEVKGWARTILNVIYTAALGGALAISAGLVYAGMRIYRRRYGTLEAEEAMTTLHLSGD